MTKVAHGLAARRPRPPKVPTPTVPKAPTPTVPRPTVPKAAARSGTAAGDREAAAWLRTLRSRDAPVGARMDAVKTLADQGWGPAPDAVDGDE